MFKISEAKRLDFILENLHFLMEGGLSLTESLNILENKINDTDKNLAKRIESTKNFLIQGQTFCEALLLAFDKKVPDIFVIFIKIGERCGNLRMMLKKALETRCELKRIKGAFIGALAYPAFICSIAVFMILGIMLFIMPKLLPIFKDLHVSLPIYTKIFIAISDVLVHFGIIILGIVTVTFILFAYFIKKSHELRFKIEKLIMRIWGIKKLFIYYHNGNIAICTSQYLKSGYSFYESMLLMSDSTNSKLYKSACMNIATEVQNGKHISVAIRVHENLFPNWPYVLDIASQSGRLAEQFERFYLENMVYIEKISIHIKRWSEPVLMLFIGGLIAMFTVSIISPIYSVVQNVAI